MGGFCIQRVYEWAIPSWQGSGVGETVQKSNMAEQVCLARGTVNALGDQEPQFLQGPRGGYRFAKHRRGRRWGLLVATSGESGCPMQSHLCVMGLGEGSPFRPSQSLGKGLEEE